MAKKQPKKSSKKPTLAQRNASMRDVLLKQKVSTSKGFLKKQLKEFIVDELIHASNNHRKAITAKTSVQKRYEQFKKYYEMLFTTGLTGHAQFTGTIEVQAKKDMERGIEYRIREKGKERKVSISELAYKMELTAHKLSIKHDVAYTKFKPVYYLLGKGKYKIIIDIPDLKEFEELEEEGTVEDIMEWFDSNNMEAIVSDPTKYKGAKDKKKHAIAVDNRKKRIRKSKEKYYKRWKAGKKAVKTKQANAAKKKRKRKK